MIELKRPKGGSRHGPRLFLAGLCAALLVLALFHRGHSVESIDVRTYAQMIRGVADHGLPYWDNGPVDRFTALVVPWGVAKNGHIWGIYGALYAYLAAPAFRIGGLQLVSQLTFALLVPLAIATFLLARRLVRDEWYAALAAFLVVASTPVAAKSLEITAYPLATVLAAVAAYLSLRSVDASGNSRGTSLASGLVWGAASATHAACFPMALVAFAFTATAPGRPAGSSPRSYATRLLGPALVGFAAFLVPMAVLNRIRFGSYNPISYGPMPWTGVFDPYMLKQNIGDELRYAAPCIVFGAALAAALYATRHRKSWWIAVATAGLVAAMGIEPLRTRFLGFALVAVGFVFDLRWVDMGSPYDPMPDGIGVSFGGFVVKSTLQCTPILALAPFAARVRDERRWSIVFLLAIAAALYASLVLRANQSMVDAIGWPWVYIRYTFPALPMLVVASVVAFEAMRPGRVDALVAAAVAIAVGAQFWSMKDDTSATKRVALLVLPLALGLVAVVAASIRKSEQPASPWLRPFAAAALGLGVAIAIGSDYRANMLVKAGCDGEVDKLDAVLPKRFGLVGVLGQFDVILSTAMTHDVQYADLLRVPEYAAIRPVLDYWRAEDRPVYVYSHDGPPKPWADVSYVPVEGQWDLFLVQFAPLGSAQR